MTRSLETNTSSNDPTDGFHYFPTVEHIRRNAPVGKVRRAIARYLFPKNPEASVRRHEAMGTDKVKKGVMHTVGKLPFTKVTEAENNYHLNGTKRHLDAEMEFATKGSVINEAIHTGGALAGVASIASEIASNAGETSVVIAAGALAVNGLMVAVQRYNRARLTRSMNHDLAHGKGFSPTYTNWLGMDSNGETMAEFQALDQWAAAKAAQQPSEESQPPQPPHPEAAPK